MTLVHDTNSTKLSTDQKGGWCNKWKCQNTELRLKTNQHIKNEVAALVNVVNTLMLKYNITGVTIDFLIQAIYTE